MREKRMLFWQKAFKSIAYGDFQNARLFCSEMGMVKQCQLKKTMGLATRHDRMWLGAKAPYPKIACICVCQLLLLAL